MARFRGIQPCSVRWYRKRRDAAWLHANALVTCALLVEDFRELRPAVSGETKEEPLSRADFVMCTSPSSMSASPCFWNDQDRGYSGFGGSGVGLFMDRNPFPARGLAEFNEAVISGSRTNAAETALERNMGKSYGV